MQIKTEYKIEKRNYLIRNSKSIYQNTRNQNTIIRNIKEKLIKITIYDENILELAHQLNNNCNSLFSMKIHTVISELLQNIISIEILQQILLIFCSYFPQLIQFSYFVK